MRRISLSIGVIQTPALVLIESRRRVCRGACGAFVRTSEHVSHYKLKSFTGDFVYLISIKPPPLPTWKSDQDFEEKKKTKNPLFLLIPNNDPRIVVKTQK